VARAHLQANPSAAGDLVEALEALRRRLRHDTPAGRIEALQELDEAIERAREARAALVAARDDLEQAEEVIAAELAHSDPAALNETLEQFERLTTKVLADTEAELEQARRFNVELAAMLAAINETMAETDRRWRLERRG
jgi:hypothetical protein